MYFISSSRQIFFLKVLTFARVKSICSRKINWYLNTKRTLSALMVLNYIWIAFFLIAFIFGVIALITGDAAVLQKMLDATFSASKGAFETSLGLTGVLALWLGTMKIGWQECLVRCLRSSFPTFRRIIPLWVQSS